MAKRKLSARALVADVRSGMTDGELMAKYRLSKDTLTGILLRLVESKVLDGHELRARTDLFNEKRRVLQEALGRTGIDAPDADSYEELVDRYCRAGAQCEREILLRGSPADIREVVGRVHRPRRTRWGLIHYAAAACLIPAIAVLIVVGTSGKGMSKTSEAGRAVPSAREASMHTDSERVAQAQHRNRGSQSPRETSVPTSNVYRLTTGAWASKSAEKWPLVFSIAQARDGEALKKLVQQNEARMFEKDQRVHVERRETARPVVQVRLRGNVELWHIHAGCLEKVSR